MLQVLPPSPVEGDSVPDSEDDIPAGVSAPPSKHTVDDLTALTAKVAASFVSNNTVCIGDLHRVINLIHRALRDLDSGAPTGVTERVPAVPPSESVTRDYIVCLEDGRRLKTLKRYIRRRYALSPEQYRERWSLPDTYPMVAPAYAQLRSSLARRKARAPMGSKL